MTVDSFPRGLYQPEHSFRFSSDALLLAAFADGCGDFENVLDLGAGCGVVGFSLLLRRRNIRGCAVEIQPVLATAAKYNAALLGLENRFSVFWTDVANICHGKKGPIASCVGDPFTGERPLGMDENGNGFGREDLYKVHKRGSKNADWIMTSTDTDSVPAPDGHETLLLPDSFDLALANPPYRIYGQGRQPKEEARLRALFGNWETLADFCRAAARALRPGGYFAVAFAAARLTELFACLEECGLGPRRLVCVHGKKDRKADFVLVEAKKGARADLRVEAPLILSTGVGEKTRLSGEALAFCPELACNAG